VQLTKGSEAGAYFLAVGITSVALYLLGPVAIAPFYTWLVETHRAVLAGWASYGISGLTWLVTLLLFLALRSQLDGVPAIVTAYDPERPVTTFWAEIMAYVTVSVVVQIILSVLGILLISGLYIALQRNGQASLRLLVAIAERTVAALAFFAMFVLLRGIILSKRTE
jgi:hypothetical protein